MPVHTRDWWRKREKASCAIDRVTPYLEKGWSGTLAEVLALPIDDANLIWAACQPGAMPDRLAMRCILKLVDLFPVGSPPKRIFPPQAIMNLLEYADGGSRKDMEASRPVTIAHYGTAAERLFTVQRHFYVTGQYAGLFRALVVSSIREVIDLNVAV